jgi:hypothetical protein
MELGLQQVMVMQGSEKITMLSALLGTGKLIW